MKHICIFIFSCWVSYITAQDTLTNQYSLRVGVDLYKIGLSIANSNYKGFEIVGDLRITPKIYIATELGTEDRLKEDDRFTYTTKGTYIKAGLDYNTYENWGKMKNFIGIGLRYGVSQFSQQLHSYTIYQSSNYYGTDTYTPNTQFSGLSAGWLELVGSLKAEVLPNLYAGFSVRLNYLLHDTQPDNFANLYIPGFNRTYEGSFGSGFNYTLTYNIPLFSMSNKTNKI